MTICIYRYIYIVDNFSVDISQAVCACNFCHFMCIIKYRQSPWCFHELMCNIKFDFCLLRRFTCDICQPIAVMFSRTHVQRQIRITLLRRFSCDMFQPNVNSFVHSLLVVIVFYHHYHCCDSYYFELLLWWFRFWNYFCSLTNYLVIILSQSISFIIRIKYYTITVV